MEKQAEIKDQVQETLKKQPGKAVDRDAGSGGQSTYFSHERQPGEEQPEEAPASNASPWMGNLVNIKV